MRESKWWPKIGKIKYLNTQIINPIHFHFSQFDRQDSLRSDYMSDRESRFGIVHQASIESTDSRLCYLTSSEVSAQIFSFNFSRAILLRHLVTSFNYTFKWVASVYHLT